MRYMVCLENKLFILLCNQKHCFILSGSVTECSHLICPLTVSFYL